MRVDSGVSPATLRKSIYQHRESWKDFGFDAATDTHDVKVTTMGNVGEKSVFILTVGMMPGALQYIFQASVGDVSDPLENDNFLAVFTVDTVIAPGSKPFEDVKEILKVEVRKSILHSHQVNLGTNKYDPEKVEGSLKSVSSREDKMKQSLKDDLKSYEGMLDEVGIWSKALTATEVSDLYNSGNGLAYDATGDSFAGSSG